MTTTSISADANAKLDAKFEEERQKNLQETYDRLRELGGGKVGEDNAISYHEGTQILLPRKPQVMTKKNAAKFMAAAAKADEEETQFSRQYKYRPWDGAYSTQITLKQLFGTQGNGVATYSIFGKNPPKMIEISTGPAGQTVSVPWGRLELPYRDSSVFLDLGGRMTHDGSQFVIQVTAPKKYEHEMRGVLEAIEITLRTNSIYKGKAFEFSKREDEPQFIDVYSVKRDAVAYSEETFRQLKHSIWGRINTAAAHRAAGIPLNKKTLVYGPYGTGKTLSAILTAQTAIEQGWTYIQAKADEANLQEILGAAKVYAPAVVAIEDIDKLLDTDDMKFSQMLDLFDGVSSKNNEVAIIMTTNHVDKIPKAMLRSGRIDSMIEISQLDKPGIERLLKSLFHDGELDPKIVDFEKVFEAMAGFPPAFIVTTLENTRSAAIVRTGEIGSKLATADFISAADSLRGHVERHDAAGDRPLPETFGTAMQKLVQKATADELSQHYVDAEGDHWAIGRSEE